MSTFAGGSKVYLRICAFGQPGTVVGLKGRKVLVLWHDLDYLARHSAASLIAAEQDSPDLGGACD